MDLYAEQIIDLSKILSIVGTCETDFTHSGVNTTCDRGFTFWWKRESERDQWRRWLRHKHGGIGTTEEMKGKSKELERF